MNKFLLVVLTAYIFLAPFYIFPSGTPQPADMILIVAFFVLLFQKETYLLFQQGLPKLIGALFLLIFFINGSWFLYSGATKVDMLTSTIFYLFNLLVFLLAGMLLKTNLRQTLRWILWATLFTVVLQVFLFFIVGVNSGRTTIFFNNPNQLGYFALLSTCIFGITNYYVKVKNIYSIVFYVASFCLVLFSGSRAAVGGLLILAGFEMIRSINLSKKRNLSFLLLVILFLPFLFFSPVINNQLFFFQQRIEKGETNNVPEYKVRGYDKIIEYPQYTFLGAGEGWRDRFVERSFSNLEIHSAFGTMLFSYGFLGLCLFLFIFYLVIKSGPVWINAIYLLPVLAYNFTHQGLRFSLFWMLLAILYFSFSLLDSKFYKKTKA